MEIEVDVSAHLAYERQQLLRCFFARHIDLLDGHHVEVLALHLDEPIHPSSGNAQLPSFGTEPLGHGKSYARSGSHDNCAFLFHLLPNS